MLSAIVITRNEEQMIADCLETLDFSDEIILVDTGNTDNTNLIAKKFKAKIISCTGANYSDFRNSGKEAASGDWLLYLDADERVSPKLKSEIISIISDPGESSVFAIPRKNIYLGKVMRFGGWGGDYVIRMFKKNALNKWSGDLHEQPDFSGKLKKLKHEIIHYSHRDLSSMVEKTLNFTTYEAKLRFESHHPQITWWRIFRVMFTEFWLRFIKLSAWRDGPEGIIDCMFQVFNTFIIYGRLWEMQHESRRI
jgi:glycosyltransferase involved in cell wall biosynthesis